MDEQYRVAHKFFSHTCSTAVNPYKTVLSNTRYRVPLHIATLVLGAQMLISCGGGATQTDTPHNVSDTYTCTHFIDATAGADSNSGLSPENAWASADRAATHTRSASARAGEAICFKRGQRFVISSGRIGASGTASAPVTIGAYGDPSKDAPRLSTAIRIDNSGGWINLGNGVFRWPNSQPSWNASGLWHNGVWQKPATDLHLGNGDWYFRENDGVYFRTPNDPAISGAIYLAVKYSIFSVSRLQHVAFRDLIFEYAGAAITGRPVIRGEENSPRAIGYLKVQNCRFEHLTAGVALTSETIDGNLYENHHIEILGNNFNDIRFAVRLDTPGNGPERHRYVTIAGNTIRNIALNGRYAVHDRMQDIETIRMQNPNDTRIVDNRIELGLKFDQGVVNVEGEPLATSGIDLWRHPTVVLYRVRVERNYVRGLERGIVIGSGIEDGMRDITVSNNIVSYCTMGIKINGTDTSHSYHARFNTLFRNRANLLIASGGGQTVVNNLSAEPREYHVVLTTATKQGQMVMDYNAYTPNGRFLAFTPNDRDLFESPFDPILDRQYQDLQAFQVDWGHDGRSLAANSAGIVQPVAYAPEDFQLTEMSPAQGRGIAIGMEDGDFGGRTRFTGSAPDIGAWARHPFDG